jgi:hypothetical protein
MRLKETASGMTKFVLFFLSLASDVLLLLIGIIDELNGLYFLILDDVHIFISLSFFVVTFAWAYLLLDEFNKLDLPFSETHALTVCNRLFNFIGIWGIVTILQWHFAYTIYSNVFVNENTEALCEWILIIASAYSPYFLSKMFGNFRIIIEAETVSNFHEA